MFESHHRGNVFFTFQVPSQGSARLNNLHARVQNMRITLLGQNKYLSRGDLTKGSKQWYSRLLDDRKELWQVFADYPREIFDMSVREPLGLYFPQNLTCFDVISNRIWVTLHPCGKFLTDLPLNFDEVRMYALGLVVDPTNLRGMVKTRITGVELYNLGFRNGNTDSL